MKKVFATASLLLLLLFSLGAHQLLAQENINLVIEQFVNEAYPLLSFEITPNNDFGVPIDLLTAENFTISDELGQLETSVKELVDPDEPIAVMLVIDASGSMQQSGRLDEIKSQAITFRDSLGMFDQMGILFYSVEQEDGVETARVEIFPTADNREFAPSLDGGGAVNFINGFAAGDDQAGTPLYDAMFRSVQTLSRDTQSDRRAVIVITDGIDHAHGQVVDPAAESIPLGSSHADMEIVITTAQQENIPIFTIGLANNVANRVIEEGTVEEGTVEAEAYSGVDAIELTKIARNTGGTEAIDQNAADLMPLLSSITNRLKTKYTVTTQALTQPDNQQHDLTVQVNSNLGTSTTQQTFRALYPLSPIIELSFADNEGEIYGADRLAAGVAGTIELRPTVLARNKIARVEYWVGDAKLETTTESPFYTTIDTSLYPHLIGRSTALKVIAFDDSEVENSNELEQNMLMINCSLPCLAAENNFTTLDTGTFLAIWAALIFLVLLLIFFVLFSIIRRRRRRKFEELMLAQQQAYQFQNQNQNQFQNPMPVIPKTDEQVNIGPIEPVPPVMPPASVWTTPEPASDTIIDSPFTANSPFPEHNSSLRVDGVDQTADSASSAPPATEILSRPPTRLAYLFNPAGGQQHQLNDPTMTIGRSPENRICMPDSAVSGIHAVIKIENDEYVIYDLGASNPVMINGQTLFGSHPLSNNDRVTIGREDWIFKEIS